MGKKRKAVLQAPTTIATMTIDWETRTVKFTDGRVVTFSADSRYLVIPVLTGDTYVFPRGDVEVVRV